jgi:glycosyltransferase involved in cell wall biosynthesis
MHREPPPPPSGKTGWPWIAKPSTPTVNMSNAKGLPRISIVTPSYNQGRYLEKTIRSVLLQGYPDVEYIIIDGGSTDQSVEIIKRYEPWLAYWVSEPDQGQSDAINKGFSRSTGQIMTWLNSDDFLEFDALARMGIEFLDAEENVGAIVGIGNYIDENGGVVRCNFPTEISRKTLLRWGSAYGSNRPWTDDFLQPACLFTRQAWNYGGPLRSNLHYCMDFALWIKIAERFRFKLLPESIAYAHRHPGAKTLAKIPYCYGELALFLATLPDGFDAAANTMTKLISEEIDKQKLSKNRTLRRIARGLGIGYTRRAAYRLATAASKLWMHLS